MTTLIHKIAILSTLLCAIGTIVVGLQGLLYEGTWLINATFIILGASFFLGNMIALVYVHDKILENQKD